MASGIYTSDTRAFNPPDQKAITSPETSGPAPVFNRTHFVQPKTVYVSSPAAPAAATSQHRTTKRTLAKEALIVGGSAGAGAAIGAVAGGGKGAGIGALSGGIAGLVYDLATRNK